MPRTGPFEAHWQRYEEWFRIHAPVYRAELEAVRLLLPPQRDPALEIGAGSGLFSVPLGIRYGLEPAASMARLAIQRGMKVVGGVGETLPFRDNVFRLVLMVTAVCFVDDAAAVFAEIFRVLQPGGSLLVGFVDRNTPLGKEYLQQKDRSLFYGEAVFYSTAEVVALLHGAGFTGEQFRQTIYHPLSRVRDDEPVRPGWGEGAFVVVSVSKQ